MPPRGGYRKSNRDEWLKTTQARYAEAITSAAAMGQDLETWTADAIAHHAYRCELIACRERFAEASREAAAAMRPSPLESDFVPTRPAPTITRPEGQGTTAARRSYRP